jgi:predicted nucleic acid-binding protein
VISVDASVATKWIFPEEYSEQAWALLTRSLQTGVPMVAPPLLPSELTNIVWQRIRTGGVTHQEGEEGLSRVLALPILLLVREHLFLEALRLAAEYTLPAAYDAQYVALARSFGATLWTDDQRLIRALRGRLPFVRPIADYSDHIPL